MIKMGIKLFAGLILAVTLVTQVYAASPERWKIGHLRQSGSAIDKDIHKLIDEISKYTENRIVFDVYSGSRLGDYSIVQERVSFGEVQLYVGPLATSIDKRLLIATTPYLVNNWSKARSVSPAESPTKKSWRIPCRAKHKTARRVACLFWWPRPEGTAKRSRESGHQKRDDHISCNIR